jgi:hypothetical protein
MGRGRAKAKQQKVARDLKYNTHSTDLAALQRELGGPAGEHHLDGDEAGDADDEFDETDDDDDDDETDESESDFADADRWVHRTH